MPELIAVDAGKRKINASKAVSAGLFEAAQTKRQTLLVRPVEGRRAKKIEGAWSLLKGAACGCRGPIGFNSSAIQCGLGTKANGAIHLQELPREGLSSNLSTKVEGLND